MANTLTFDAVLDSVEQWPLEAQVELIEIIRRRLIQRRRAEIARHITEVREAYRAGQVKRGTVEEILLMDISSHDEVY